MSDVMSVRLHLSGVGVTGVLVDSVERLEVEVESAREWSRCRHCGFRCFRVWDRRPKRVRDLGVKRPPDNPGVASTPVRMWELWGTAPPGPCPVRSRVDPPVRSSSSRRCNGDVDSGGGPPSWGGVASDNGVGESPLGAGGAASPGPAVSCAVGRRNVDTAPSPVCDCGRLWRQRQGVSDDPGPYERVFGQVL